MGVGGSAAETAVDGCRDPAFEDVLGRGGSWLRWARRRLTSADLRP